MSIAFDAAAALTTTWGSGTITSQNFTVGSGLNRLLVIPIYYYATTPNIAGVSFSSLAYNGVACSRLSRSDDGVHLGVELWYVVAPASGSHAVTGSYSGSPDFIAWGASAWTGVDQATPLVLGSTAGANQSSATMLLSLGLRNYGLAAVLGTFAALEGPMNTPTPLNSNAFAGSLVNTGGAGISGDYLRLDYGAYTPGATQSWNSNDGTGYSYLAVAASFNPAAQLPMLEPPFFSETKDAYHTIEACEYGRF